MPVPSKKFVRFSNEGSGDSTRKWIRQPTRPTDPSIGIAQRCVTMHSAHRFPTKQALLFRRESPNHTWTVEIGEETLDENRESREPRPAQKLSDLGVAAE